MFIDAAERCRSVENIKMERRRGDVVKAEAAERYRKRRGDTDRYYTSKRDVEDGEEVDKGVEHR